MIAYLNKYQGIDGEGFETGIIRCNKCGKPFDDYDEKQNASIHKRIGYGSKYDGETIALNLCCECFDDLIDSCLINPIK